MATWTKATAVLIAAAAAVLAFAWWPDAAAPPPTATAGGDSQAVATALTKHANQEPVAATAGSERTAASPAATGSLHATIRGRCIDERGAPVAGCAAKLGGWVARTQGFGQWLLEHGEAPIELETSSAADGRFQFSLAPPAPYSFALELLGDGWAKARIELSKVEPGAVLDAGDITMQAGTCVRGRIVDVAGAPVEAQILSEHSTPPIPGARALRSAGAFSRADGTFTFTNSLPLGSYTLRVGDGYTVQSPAPLELTAPSPATEIRVVVARSDVPTITGTVADEADRPVIGARVTWGTTAQPLIDGGDSKRSGAFTLRCTTGDATKPVQLVASQYGYETMRLDGDVAWGARDVRIRMKRGTDLTVVVRDALGKPLEGCTVGVMPADKRISDTSTEKVRTRADGIAAFDRLVAGDYLVVAQFGPSRGVPPRLERITLAGSPAQLELRCGHQPSRRLRVVRGDGTPVAATRVQLCELVGTGFAVGRPVLAAGEWFDRGVSGPRILVLVDAPTSDDGTLLLTGPAGRELGLRVLGPGHAAVERADVRLDVAGDLVITVASGARLRGRIEPAAAVDELRRLAGAHAGKAFVAETRPRIQLRRGDQVVPRSEGRPAEAEGFGMADDGAFDVAGLPAGQWQVILLYFVKSAWMTVPRHVELGTRVLTDGGTLDLLADLTHLLPGTIRGLALRNGEPWARNTVVVESTHGIGADGNDVKEFAPIETGVDGRFEYTTRPGRYRVRRADDDKAFAVTTVELRSGEVVDATFEFGVGELAVRLLLPDGSPARGVGVWMLGHELADTLTNADGRTSKTIAPATVSLRVLPKRLQSQYAQDELRRDAWSRGVRDPFAAHWIELGQATVVAGRTTTLELRLPAEWEK